MRYYIFVSLFLMVGAVYAQSTKDMVDQSEKELQTLKSKLGKHIVTFENTLDKKAKALFQKEQESWALYIKNKASFAADKARGGSLASLIANEAAIDAYNVRIKELIKYIKTYNDGPDLENELKK